MNQNWIVENLNNAFSTWNGKLTELWGLVTTGPQSFKGGAVWGVMQNLHNAMVGIGYALVVLFFAISLFKNTMNFHELKRPEAAVHYLIRFVAAKALVGYGMDIMLNIFSICNGVITDMTSGMGGISQAMVSLPGEMQTAIENVGFLASIPLWLVTILGSLFITVLSFVMILTVYQQRIRRCDPAILHDLLRGAGGLHREVALGVLPQRAGNRVGKNIVLHTENNLPHSITFFPARTRLFAVYKISIANPERKHPTQNGSFFPPTKNFSKKERRTLSGAALTIAFCQKPGTMRSLLMMSQASATRLL